MNKTPKRFQSFEILADDILEGRYCKEDLPKEMRTAILVRLLIDLYWEGWHDYASGKHDMEL